MKKDLLFESLVESAFCPTQEMLNLSRLHGAVSAKVWVMADGTKIYISQMRGNHIRNCMAMLRRNSPHYGDELAGIANRYLQFFDEELKNRYSSKDPTEGFFDETEVDGI